MDKRLSPERSSAMLYILLIVLILLMVGATPIWPHSDGWSLYPSGTFLVVVIILIILLGTGRL